jgi:hypothetical protein
MIIIEPAPAIFSLAAASFSEPSPILADFCLADSGEPFAQAELAGLCDQRLALYMLANNMLRIRRQTRTALKNIA